MTTVTTVERDDSGFTLVELIVAMSIFAALLAIFGVAVQSFSKSTVRTLQTSDQSTQARVVYSRFDKQVRSAYAISVPGLVGVKWYVEYLDTTVDPNVCTQWVLRTDTHVLETRKWNDGATTAPAWRQSATNVANTTAAAQAPFVLTKSTTTVPLQQLSVRLRYQQGSGPLTVSNSVFTARNSLISSPTNGSGIICNSSTWRS